MKPAIVHELAAYRRTWAGQMKNLMALASIPVGLFFWFRDRNLIIAVPMAVMTPLVLQLPAFLYRRLAWIHEAFTVRLLKIFELPLVLVLALSTAGSAWLFYLKYQFDILVHFLENFIFAFLIVVIISLRRVRRGRPPLSARAAAWIVPLAGLSLSLLWEVYQSTCDALLHSKMAFDSYQTWLSDSASDSVGGLLGAILGALFIVLPFWDHLMDSLRRRPAG